MYLQRRYWTDTLLRAGTQRTAWTKTGVKKSKIPLYTYIYSYYAQWEADETTDDVEIPSVDFGEVTFDEEMPDDHTVELEIPVEKGATVAITDVSCNSDNFDVTFAGDTVTVSPKDSLNAGEYTGTVCVYTTVTDSEGIKTTPTYWFDVSLTVEKKDSPISFAESLCQQGHR